MVPYRRLMLRAQARLTLSRVRLARAEVFTSSLFGGSYPGDWWLAELAADVERWERVRRYLHLRSRLARAFAGVCP
jgi:hypothetical protein